MAGNNRHRGKGYTPVKKGPPANYRRREREDPGRSNGTWRAVSIKPSGQRYETRHLTPEKASKRLLGNPRHTGHRILEMQAPASKG